VSRRIDVLDSTLLVQQSPCTSSNYQQERERERKIDRQRQRERRYWVNVSEKTKKSQKTENWTSTNQHEKQRGNLERSVKE
jgi:hypothetical protein